MKTLIESIDLEIQEINKNTNRGITKLNTLLIGLSQTF